MAYFDDENILDAPDTPRPELRLATKNQRFLNFFIDSLLCSGISLGVLYFLGDDFGFLNLNSVGKTPAEGEFYGELPTDSAANPNFLLNVVSVAVQFAYYTLFEYFLGKTPGKYITKTRVVAADGSPANFLNTVGRTLCRFIPFEPLSFLGPMPTGFHDTISRTRVVADEDGF